jgi:hypothetical protein
MDCFGSLGKVLIVPTKGALLARLIHLLKAIPSNPGLADRRQTAPNDGRK